jgi:hypothetical protein
LEVARRSQAVSSRAFWLACAVAYVALATLYWPTLYLAPISLDDASQLQQSSHVPFGQVFDYDRFGHYRPVKSALFWLLSRHAEWLPAWRMLALAIVLASAGLGQALCTPLLRSRAWALATAICWVANPISASVLCWLSTANLAICLLGIVGYVYAAERAVRSGSGPVYAIAAVVSLWLGVSSHELGFVAPLLWIAYRRCSASASADRRRIAILAAASALCIAGCVIVQLTRDAPAIAYRSASMSRARLALHAPHYLLENLRLWFWLPGRFGVLLAQPDTQAGVVDALGWMAVVAAFAACWWLRGRDRALDFSLLWCACLLLPLMNFVPFGNTPVAMHYLYLPGLGLALAVTCAARRLPGSWWLRALVLAGLIAAWLPEQRRALASWQSADALYARTIHNYPGNVEARVNLAASYLDQKKNGAARPLLDDAARLAPNDVGLVINRAKLLAETGSPEAALAFLDTHPDLNTQAVWMQRATLLMRLDRRLEAAAAFERALASAVEPEDRFAAGYRLAIVLVQLEQYARAEALIDRLLIEFPNRPELVLGKRLLSEAR